MSRADDDADEGELNELEGPEHEMEGEAGASEDSLEKEQPASHHQLGERG
jgi:hypothetical protein